MSLSLLRQRAVHASATVSCNITDDESITFRKLVSLSYCLHVLLWSCSLIWARLRSDSCTDRGPTCRSGSDSRSPKMGKLNYLARRISGLKAGQAVSKDLKKRFPPGTGSKSAARDPFVEIDVTGKALTDEGLAQFIGDLVECLVFRDQEHPIGLARVTELHLSGNLLTVQSLPMLAEVVNLSAGDLRELDLSNNDIQIVTPDDVRKWVAFLMSFQKCFVLRKLDLGGNALGRAGIEHLARIYMKSDLDFLESDAYEVIGWDGDEAEHLSGPDSTVEAMGRLKLANAKENEGAPRSKKSPYKPKADQKHAPFFLLLVYTHDELKTYACTRGLRSIPHLILTNVSMTGNSAIHLIAMLEIQRAPEPLLSYLPVVGKAVALPESAASCKSIIWRPNDELAPHVLRMIEVSEALQQLRDSKASDTSSEGAGEFDSATQQKLQGKLRIEFTRVCKRVRLEVIKEDGVHGSTIWSTALRMMLVSRALLLEDRDRPPDEDIDIPERMPFPQPVEGPAPAVNVVTQHTRSASSGPFHPSAVSFDLQFPNLPSMAQGPAPVLCIPAGDVSDTVQSRKGPPPSQPPAPTMRRRPVRGSSKQDWRYDLPFQIWRRIIAEAVGADGILDLEQQGRIMHYASDWDVVAYGLQIKGAEVHQRLWKFLESVGCFTYTPL
ncbi:uncharacterized protein BP01DRAFT_337405 [Aspergillus saccharolyticus JOP 1030-1]|uniref:Leucine rich repeat protein n=1 Tax=Aspergillus saccharolyticus JOP 1030-1 TaxID=1450539 RepID=A0A318ZJ91_9EURO|nr:hypothetical protein BP01DRAFT_337405 [Aspergillus saccharolyticus JOP 1030-1]PYH46887.1 hypothetical protein BP01DRAFT_337405 [Aspergillus saccharolyticus JOP 1030-1]